MRMTKGILISGLALAACLALLIWSFMPDVISVETAVIKEGKFQSSFSEEGKTRLRNRYTVSAPFGGILLRPRLKAGDKVNQGDSVATLYAPPSPLLDPRTKAELQERIGIAEANMDEAVTLLDSARMQYADATKEYERVKVLTETGSATRQQFDKAQLVKDIAERSQMAAEKRRHAAEHMLEQAKQMAASYGSTGHDDQWTLTAPISGTIVKVYQESEGAISSGSPLIDLGDLQDLEIVAEILTADVVAIQQGQKVLIDKWGGKTILEGRVRLAEPAAETKISALGIEEQRTLLIVDIVTPVEQWEKLGDQFRVTVTIITNEIEHALLVPSSAIFHKGDNDYVFVTNGNRAQLRAVQIGQRSRGTAVILTGLVAGEEVIIYPPRELTDGTKIVRQ